MLMGLFVAIKYFPRLSWLLNDAPAKDAPAKGTSAKGGPARGAALALRAGLESLPDPRPGWPSPGCGPARRAAQPEVQP